MKSISWDFQSLPGWDFEKVLFNTTAFICSTPAKRSKGWFHCKMPVASQWMPMFDQMVKLTKKPDNKMAKVVKMWDETMVIAERWETFINRCRNCFSTRSCSLIFEVRMITEERENSKFLSSEQSLLVFPIYSVLHEFKNDYNQVD